jgi:mannose-6-phosphate isomerase-like protein (cupin superfamily)
MTILLLLMIAAQEPATAPQTKPAPPAAPATQAPRRPAPAAGSTIQIRVTDRSGNPASGAQVTAEGASRREGTTDANGLVTFRTMTPGTYRVRAEGDRFVALEKEIAIRGGGAAAQAEFALSAAPEAAPAAPATPPPAPAAPPPPPMPTGAPGQPTIVSIPDLAERSLGGRNPVSNQPIACSGLERARLLLVRDPLPPASREDADEMLYLVAGEATLRLADREQAIAPGSFAVVPRNTSYSVTRRGRNPAILLSVIAGEPCLGDSARR